jgi:hypothetical protein
MILYGAVFEVISVASFWLFGDWWVLGLILFIAGTPFATVSIALGFGLWKGKNWARNITTVLIYFEITLVVFSVIGINTIMPFPFSLHLFGVYSLIPILYTIGKDILSLYYLSRPNTKAYFGQIKK